MEAYVKGKNVNTVQFPDKCLYCKKKDCDEYIKIEVFVPIHSGKCFVNHFHEIMKLNECGNPNIDTIKTLKKFIKLKLAATDGKLIYKDKELKTTKGEVKTHKILTGRLM